MAGKRNVIPGHTIVTDESKLENVTPEAENDDVYEPGLAPLAATVPSEGDETPVGDEDNFETETDAEGQVPDEGDDAPSTADTVVVKLVKAGSFRRGSDVYVKNVPVPVPAEKAESLLRTNYFVVVE